MPRRTPALILSAALTLLPPPDAARAETEASPAAANLSASATGAPGAVARLVAAQRAYEAALVSGDTLLLLVAIRLARGVTLRAPTAWEKTTTGEAASDPPQGRPSAHDPAGAEAIAIVQGLAGEDPDLQDLVYDLDAQLPRGRPATAIATSSDLGPGQTEVWRMPLSGEVATEIAVIGDGDSPLALSVLDEGGAVLCLVPQSPDPGLCRLTPARNGFFTVTIRNAGQMQNSYRLLAN